MKADSRVAGGLTILVLSCLLLLLQAGAEYQYLSSNRWLAAAQLCTADSSVAKPLFCTLPLWTYVIVTAVHFLVVMVSLVRYKNLSRRWWYIAVPVVSLLASSFVISVIPIVYVETVA